MPLYFAYGATWTSRPWRGAARPRVLSASRACRATRWIISTDGYANVVRDPRLQVHGLLWQLALSDVPVLDRFEDVPRLYRKVTQPVISAAGIRRALVYVGRAVEPGRPRPGYLDDVVHAAEGADLPAAAIAEMRRYGDVRPSTAPPTTAAKLQKWQWSP